MSEARDVEGVVPGVASPRIRARARALEVWPWLLLLLFPLIELGGHAAVLAGVPPDADWQAAAAVVRSERRPGDLITVAPAWADPLLRRVLGDSIDLAMAGRSDTAAYDRVWALSIRGADVVEAPPAAPELERRFGAVTLRRWTLGPSPVVYDLVEHVREARVTIGQRPCEWARLGLPGGGGLGKGVLYPVERFECDAKRSWLWVAPVVMEDLALQPRRCVWQHPAGNEPIGVTFADAPLGASLVFHGGLYYEHERMRRGGPVTARITLDGRELGRMVHRDGDGWKRLELPLPAGRPRGSLGIQVTAPAPHLRSFCWAASVRRGTR